MRHADAGYEDAIACAREHGLNLPGVPRKEGPDGNPSGPPAYQGLVITGLLMSAPGLVPSIW